MLQPEVLNITLYNQLFIRCGVLKVWGRRGLELTVIYDTQERESKSWEFSSQGEFPPSFILFSLFIVSVWEDILLTELQWSSFHNICKSNHHTVYALNLYRLCTNYFSIKQEKIWVEQQLAWLGENMHSLWKCRYLW